MGGQQDLAHWQVVLGEDHAPGVHQEWLTHGRNGLKRLGVGRACSPSANGRPTGRDCTRSNKNHAATVAHVLGHADTDVGQHLDIDAALLRRDRRSTNLYDDNITHHRNRRVR